MDKIIVDEEKIDELLNRSVEDIIVKEDLKARLMSGKQLRIKLGIDPTGPKIHLGRAIPLRKLREFQKLGHQAVLIVGNFTAQVGDASDKEEKRPILTRAEIDNNLSDYKSQIAKILDISKTEFVYNNDWLSKLTLNDVVELSECFTVQQMLARRNFKERYEAGKEISLREFLYPIMQGYDSVAVKADVEIGGFDQLFNVKAGRELQAHYGMAKQNILTVKMLEGTDGRKMSTSWGNSITIVDDPKTMFGKIMSLRDDLIIKYFTLCTDLSEDEVAEKKKRLEGGENPRDLKLELGLALVTIYHNDKEATLAKQSFIDTFQNGIIPEDVIVLEAEQGEELGSLLVKAEIVESKAEFKRLVEQGAVSTEDGTKIDDYKREALPEIYRVGKKRFAKVIKK
jgi:tyrosyl-tRNA synthetase